MENDQFIDELINKVHDSALSESLTQIKAGAYSIWNPTWRIIDDFTDHGIKHSNRVARYVIKLINLYEGNKEWSDQELYVLTAAICLHDIGMQCDIIKYPAVRENAEKEFHAKFDSEFLALTSSSFSEKEQKAIRDNHHCITAAWIDFLYNDKDIIAFPLKSAIKSIPNSFIRDIEDVCLYHSTLDIGLCDINFYLFPTFRKRLLAAILRFGDELDIDSSRISDDAYEAFRIPPDNKMYWWLHGHTSIDLDADYNKIYITLALNPEDNNNYGQLIKDIYLDPIEKKNDKVIEVLSQNSILISILPGIKLYDYAEKLPEEIAQAMISLKDKREKKEFIKDIIYPKDAISSDNRVSLDNILKLMVESLLMTTLRLISPDDNKIFRKSISDIKQVGQLSSKLIFPRTAWQTANSFSTMLRKAVEKNNLEMLLLIAEALNDIGSKFAMQSELDGAAYESINSLWALIYITNDNVEFEGREELRLEIAEGLGEIGKIAAEKNLNTTASQASAAFGYFSSPSKELVENMGIYLINIFEISNNAHTCFHIARSLNAHNLPDEAEKAARKAISIDAEHSLYFLQLCNALRHKAIIAQHDHEKFKALDAKADEACSEYRRLKALGK